MARWTRPAAARRWGAWATQVAAIVPVLYATSRFAWALGVPLGIRESFLRRGQANGMWWVGAALATVATGGAALTLGLTQRWREVFPRWTLGLAGRRIPPALAIVRASFVSTIVRSARLVATREFVQAGFPDDGWGTTAPGLLWPLWGVALASATFAYYYRRRGPCRRCGRGA